MDTYAFRQLLNSLKSLTACQLRHLDKSRQQLQSDSETQIDKRLEAEFAKHPACPHCESEDLYRWGYSSNERQRYRCKHCHNTFNALTKTPLSALRYPEKWADYLEGMTYSQTLRRAASTCHISLRTSFLWRHRFLEVLENDMSDQLQGIIEMDETFFRESFKGKKKGLPRPARKRGNASAKKCRKIPVLVVCDRQKGHRDRVLENMTAEAMKPCFEGHLKEEALVCADAHLSHEALASMLGFELKELVTSKGQHVREGIFHIQHVNAWHSHLKQWITGIFHGIATRYLNHYLGWRRILTASKTLTQQGVSDKIVLHWQYQQLGTT